MKSLIILLLYLSIMHSLIGDNSVIEKFITVYIPGMFDNGDMFSTNYPLRNIFEERSGFFRKYYKDKKGKDLFNKYRLSVGRKGCEYNRLVVANLIGERRKDVKISTMGRRLYTMITGMGFYYCKDNVFKGIFHPIISKAMSEEKDDILNTYMELTGSESNIEVNSHDFTEDDKKILGQKILFKGLLEEIWAKYGKRVYYCTKTGRVLYPHKIKKGPLREGEINLLYYGTKTDINHILKKYKNRVSYYENQEWYYKAPFDIKINFIAHSSGGLALRKAYSISKKFKSFFPINSVIFLSVPNQGAVLSDRVLLVLNKMLQDLSFIISSKIMKNKGTTYITYRGIKKKYSYSELFKSSPLLQKILDAKKGKKLRTILAGFIYYLVPYDGKTTILCYDKTINSLKPKGLLIRSLKKDRFGEIFPVKNVCSVSQHGELFKNMGKWAEIPESDGAVRPKDAFLKDAEEIIISHVNHIPLPKIPAIFNLENTIEQFYPLLKILTPKGELKQERLYKLKAIFQTFMQEAGLDINTYFKSGEDYSIIDWFVEHPIMFK